MKITKRFTSEAEATKYWDSIGRILNGRRVVKNEIEYLKDGSFEVVTEVA